MYIEEPPNAVRTIVGVPTSIAAFVGWAPRGPADAFHITSWEDYRRVFGGLHVDSPMSQAVYQFYLNGGSEAEIVRLAGAGTKSEIQLTNGPKLQASSPGAWGSKLLARIDYQTNDPTDNTLYNLTIKDTGTGALESYLNVSITPGEPRTLTNVLNASDLVTVVSASDNRPAAHKADLPLGADPFEDNHDGTWYTKATGGNDDATIDTADYIGGNGDNFSLDLKGVYALRKTDIFNILCLPDAADKDAVLDAALKLCGERRAMLIVDPPPDWTSVNNAERTAHHLTGDATKNAAIYFPSIRAASLLHEGAVEEFPPCGVVAGVWARTDVQSGVWKAPAGTGASLSGVSGLGAGGTNLPITDLENARLNLLGINCLRMFPIVGPVCWGARTMRGADQLADQWKFVQVRRLALFIEESIYRGTKWVVFEPNDEPLRSSIRLNVGAFMSNLFRQGAFQGHTPQEAYLVKCDSTNNPQKDIDRGIVNILVGFAPQKPAEFVIIQIQQLAGQVQV